MCRLRPSRSPGQRLRKRWQLWDSPILNPELFGVGWDREGDGDGNEKCGTVRMGRGGEGMGRYQPRREQGWRWRGRTGENARKVNKN